MEKAVHEKTDQQLVAASLENPSHYGEIIERYRPALTRYIRRIGCSDNHATEDILQDVFISVYRNLNSYDTDLSFSSWIYRIAHNKTISFFRKSEHKNISLEDDDYTIIIYTAVTEEKKGIDTTDKQLLNKALDTLPSHYREVLVLFYLEEKSYDTIADILQKPPGTIATLLHRAKKQLKDILTNYHYEQ